MGVTLTDPTPEELGEVRELARRFGSDEDEGLIDIGRRARALLESGQTEGLAHRLRTGRDGDALVPSFAGQARIALAWFREQLQVGGDHGS